MIKTVTIILLCVLGISLVAKPAWEKVSQVINKDHKGELEEARVVGITSIYNPRVKEVQQILKTTSLYEGDIDGMMGDATRTAIREFQVKSNIEPTGKVNEATWLALTKVKVYVDFRQHPPDVGEHKPAVVGQAVALNTPQPVVKRVIEPLPEEIPVAKTSKHLRLTKNQIKSMQITLRKLGFYQGKIDGVVGKQTRKAVVAFQKSKRLKADGVVGPKTWAELCKNL